MVPENRLPDIMRALHRCLIYTRNVALKHKDHQLNEMLDALHNIPDWVAHPEDRIEMITKELLNCGEAGGFKAGVIQQLEGGFKGGNTGARDIPTD